MGQAPWWFMLRDVVPILLLIALVALIVWAVLRTTRQRPLAASPAGGASRTDPALEHARMRYAQGEIDRDQYQRIALDLSGAEPGWPAATSSPPSP